MTLTDQPLPLCPHTDVRQPYSLLLDGKVHTLCAACYYDRLRELREDFKAWRDADKQRRLQQ